MKLIHWFPGHMAKAMRLMEDNLKLCDAVVFVLDARAPASTYNPKLSELVGQKPVLFLFNKCDLADGKADELLTLLKESGKNAVKLNATAQNVRPLQSAMEELVAEKTARLKEKGSKKPLRFLIAGVPNTGKSTVINALSGSKKAQVGDKAGVTRGKQWVKCGSFELMDTPGTMPPSFSDQTLARRLAYIGSVNDDILEMDEIALCLLEELSEKYPQGLKERFEISGGTPLEMLEQVCKKRGFLLRGGEFDYERGERALIDDFRKGKLGRVCLDTKEDMQNAGLI